MIINKVVLLISMVLIAHSAFNQELVKVTPIYKSGTAVLFMSSFKGELYFGSSVGSDPWGTLVWKYNRFDGKVEELEASEGFDKSIFSSVQSSDKYLYFSYDNALFRTDGTDAGNVKLSEGKFVQPYLIPYEGSSLLFFTREDYSDDKLMLNFSNGTMAGTKMIKAFDRDCGKMLGAMYSKGRRANVYLSNGKDVFFLLNEENCTSLWKTDGTTDGTILLMSFPGNSVPTDFLISDGILYFTYDDFEEENNPGRLWKSDGTVAGTIKLDADGTQFLGKAGDEVLYQKDGKIVKLKSQEQVADLSQSYNSFSNQEHVNNVVFITVEGQSERAVLRSDGTPSGTFIVRDIDLDNCYILGSCHENIYFSCGSFGGSKILSMTDKSTVPEIIGEIQDSFPVFISCEKDGLYFTALSDSVNYVYLLKNTITLNNEKSFPENEQELNVYPVPSSGSVKIETPIPGKLLISNISGKKILETNVEKFIYLENLETGLYFTELSIDGKILRKVFSVIR